MEDLIDERGEEEGSKKRSKREREREKMRRGKTTQAGRTEKSRGVKGGDSERGGRIPELACWDEEGYV